MNTRKPTLAVLGGTGDLGTGLANRWAAAGYPIVIGSRTTEKAKEAADALRSKLSSNGISADHVRGMENLSAAAEADIGILTVPFRHQATTLNHVKAALHGKILIDVTVPLVPPKVARVQLPEQGSAGKIAQQILGDDVQVVSAFHNVAAAHLIAGNDMSCDVIVCGNKKAARAIVIEMIEAIGLRGFHGGSIDNSAAAEALTSVLIFINKQYGGHAGIAITGIDGSNTHNST